MGRDLPLGRIAGIPLRVDISVLLIAAINTWTLATLWSPRLAPDVSETAYWASGVAGSLLYFASLLVHEMGHALVARGEGVGVRSISLWLLGGMAKLESSPNSAAAEFRIAVVGPLASAAFGVVCLVGAYLLQGDGMFGLVGGLLLWAGLLNMILAAFNLLPAAPLDGGTVLSSLVWWRTGSQAKGVTWAAWAGLTMGAGMAWWGLANMGDRGGIWIVVVGGFIGFSAFRSLRAAPLFRLLEGVTVDETMRAHPPIARSRQTIADFLRSLPPHTTHQQYPMVADHGRVSGLLSAAAIRAVPEDRWSTLTVADLAFPLDRLTVVATTDAVLPAVQKIDGGDVRTGLVVDPAGTVVGTIDAAALFHKAEMNRIQLQRDEVGSAP